MAGALMKIQSRYAYDPESDLLGSGGFARVFRARDELLQRDVALKVFNLTGSHDYTVLNEIRKVIQLAHPNLMRYFDVILLEQSNALGEKEQLQIGVMEYANAGDLKQFARANPGSAQLEVLLAEVLHGLAYLHARDIVHRDLKAQNILLVRQGERLTAKLADFGVSKELGQAGKSSSVMVGTIEYMAPEQFSPQRYGIDGKIGPSLDLWSFGVMVHELLTGRTPFGGRDGAMTTEQIMRAILSSELPAGVEQLPEPYRSVIERCLVADAKDRIRSANELLRYFDGGSGPAAAVVPAAEVRDEDATRLLAKDLVPSPLPRRRRPRRTWQPDLLPHGPSAGRSVFFPRWRCSCCSWRWALRGGMPRAGTMDSSSASPHRLPNHRGQCRRRHPRSRQPLRPSQQPRPSHRTTRSARATTAMFRSSSC